jgi:hypothetical protein
MVKLLLLAAVQAGAVDLTRQALSGASPLQPVALSLPAVSFFPDVRAELDERVASVMKLWPRADMDADTLQRVIQLNLADAKASPSQMKGRYAFAKAMVDPEFRAAAARDASQKGQLDRLAAELARNDFSRRTIAGVVSALASSYDGAAVVKKTVEVVPAPAKPAAPSAYDKEFAARAAEFHNAYLSGINGHYSYEAWAKHLVTLMVDRLAKIDDPEVLRANVAASLAVLHPERRAGLAKTDAVIFENAAALLTQAPGSRERLAAAVSPFDDMRFAAKPAPAAKPAATKPKARFWTRVADLTRAKTVSIDTGPTYIAEDLRDLFHDIADAPLEKMDVVPYPEKEDDELHGTSRLKAELPRPIARKLIERKLIKPSWLPQKERRNFGLGD